MRLRYSPAGNKKNLLLKTNNKQIGNEVNKVKDIAIRSLIAYGQKSCRHTLKTMAPHSFNSNNYL